MTRKASMCIEAQPIVLLIDKQYFKYTITQLYYELVHSLIQGRWVQPVLD